MTDLMWPARAMGSSLLSLPMATACLASTPHAVVPITFGHNERGYTSGVLFDLKAMANREKRIFSSGMRGRAGLILERVFYRIFYRIGGLLGNADVLVLVNPGHANSSDHLAAAENGNSASEAHET